MGARKSYTGWSPADVEQLRQLCAAGVLAPDIQAQYMPHRTLEAVRGKIVQLKLGPINAARVATVRPVASYQPPEGAGLVEVLAPEASRDETDDELDRL